MAGSIRSMEQPSWFRRALNAGVAVAYFFGAHLYDSVCYAVSNLYSYPRALVIMSLFLFTASGVLVALHSAAARRWGWDILGLGTFNALRDERDIPSRRLFKQLMRWSLNQGRWWIFGIGSIMVGPAVITPLLAKRGSLASMVLLLSAGTLVSVLFWVTVWSGVGLFTWEQYVLPLARTVWPS